MRLDSKLDVMSVEVAYLERMQHEAQARTSCRE